MVAVAVVLVLLLVLELLWLVLWLSVLFVLLFYYYHMLIAALFSYTAHTNIQNNNGPAKMCSLTSVLKFFSLVFVFSSLLWYHCIVIFHNKENKKEDFYVRTVSVCYTHGSQLEKSFLNFLS